jgi:hypothetical protein
VGCKCRNCCNVPLPVVEEDVSEDQSDTDKDDDELSGLSELEEFEELSADEPETSFLPKKETNRSAL